MEIVLTTILILIVLTTISYKESRLSYFSPFILIMAFYTLFYFVRGFVILLFPGAMKIKFYVHSFSLESTQTAMNVALVGLIFLYIGYQAVSLPAAISIVKRSNRPQHTDMKYIYVASLIFFLVWVGVTSYKSYLGFIHYGGEQDVAARTSFGPSYVLSLIQTISQFSFNSIIYCFCLTRKKKPLLFAVMLFMIYNAVTSGGTFALINLIFTFLTIKLYGDYFGLKKSSSRASLVKVISLIIISVPTIYVAFFLKEVMRFLLVADITPLELLNNTTLLTSLIDKVSISNLLVTITSRTHGIDSLAIIIESKQLDRVEINPFNFFYLFLAGVIPRFIWNGKPEISLGQWFTENLWYKNIDETGFQSTAMFVPGDLYLHFGIIGVIVGMFYYGLFLKIQLRIVFTMKNKMFGFLFLSSSFFYFIFYEYTFAGHVLQQLRTFLLLGLFYQLLKISARFRIRGSFRSPPKIVENIAMH